MATAPNPDVVSQIDGWSSCSPQAGIEIKKIMLKNHKCTKKREGGL